MDYPLSNLDLNKYIKECVKSGVNIYQMKELTPKTNIEDIFNGGGHCIFFYENAGSNIGHWITMLRDPEKNIYFMDSYGMPPEYYNKNLKQCLKNAGAKSLYINKQKLQGDRSMTCGRYGIVFTCLHKAKMHPTDMIDFLKEGAKKYGSVDKYIVKLFDE